MTNVKKIPTGEKIVCGDLSEMTVVKDFGEKGIVCEISDGSLLIISHENIQLNVSYVYVEDVGGAE